MSAITLPDGSVRRFDAPVTGAEVAAAIGPGLATAIVSRADASKMFDLSVDYFVGMSSCDCLEHQGTELRPGNAVLPWTGRIKEWPIRSATCPILRALRLRAQASLHMPAQS